MNPRIRIRRTGPLAATLGVAAAALACGSAEPEPQGFEIDPETLARIEAAFQSLQEIGPELAIPEVLRTCDKWRHPDKPCVDEEVRVDALICWEERGEKEARFQRRRKEISHRKARRGPALAVLRLVNVCMERRGWVRIEKGPDF